MNIEYFIEKTYLGNVGAIFKLRDKLDDNFLLLNVDSIFDIDFNWFVELKKAKTGYS